MPNGPEARGGPGAHDGAGDTTSEDQREVTAFLAALPDGGGAVERIDTHISHVFLVGDRVYKLKRAVRLPYLDFSDVEARRAACEAELEVNRRTAPSLYLAVRAVTREADGPLALDGAGRTVDWVVEMARFDGDGLFDRLATRGRLDEALVSALADEVAEFHGRAEPATDLDAAGAVARVRVVVEGNAAAMARCSPAIVPKEAEDLRGRSLSLLERLEPLLGARAEAGLVRDVHGDLHLRNVCLVDGRPTLFDAVEFDPELRRIDLFYDLAFLLMDMLHRGLDRAANTLLNRYLDRRQDEGGLATLPLFLSMRAAIRAHVTATTGLSTGAAEDPGRNPELADYMARAAAFLDPSPPLMIAVGGLSGTGKTTLARRLAPFAGPAPGARLLRSDVIRKRQAGVPETERLPKQHYSAQRSAEVRDALLDRARVVLEAGHAAILDSVAGESGWRRALDACADRAGAGFVGLWLEAPLSVRERRVAARSADASDADVSVVRSQTADDPAAEGWRIVDASGDVEETVRKARAALADMVPPR